MNCPNPNSGNPCGAVFFPDEDVTSQICDVGGGGCKKVTVDQIYSWLLPGASLPQSGFDDFDAGPIENPAATHVHQGDRVPRALVATASGGSFLATQR